jgi:hypothetical protein
MLRLAPVAFGVGIVWGMIDLVHAFVPAGAPTAARLDDVLSRGLQLDTQGAADFGGLAGIQSALAAATAKVKIFLFAALPIYAYFVFLLLHFVVDISYAVLSVPGKLDKLRRDNTHDEESQQ